MYRIGIVMGDFDRQRFCTWNFISLSLQRLRFYIYSSRRAYTWCDTWPRIATTQNSCKVTVEQDKIRAKPSSRVPEDRHDTVAESASREQPNVKKSRPYRASLDMTRRFLLPSSLKCWCDKLLKSSRVILPRVNASLYYRYTRDAQTPSYSVIETRREILFSL